MKLGSIVAFYKTTTCSSCYAGKHNKSVSQELLRQIYVCATNAQLGEGHMIKAEIVSLRTFCFSLLRIRLKAKCS